MTKGKYVYAVDVLRVIAILAVLLIHTTTRTLEQIGYDLNRVPWTLFLNQVPSFAVALFFMISGFVLELGYEDHGNFLQYLKKRFNRIFVPYVFWSAVYYFFVYRTHSENFLQVILTGDASYQLYFIPSLAILYLIFPVIHKIYKLISNKWIFTILGLIEVYILYQDYYLKNLPFHTAVNYVFFNYFVFIAGMVASRNMDKLVSILKKLWPILAAASVYFIWEIYTQGKSMYFKTYNIDAFYSRHRPSILFYTISLFGTLFYFFENFNFGSKFVKLLSRLSFFVFFVHVIVLEGVWVYAGLPIFKMLGDNFYSQIWFDPAFFAVVTVVSFFLAHVAHKIPYIQKITG